MLKKFFVNFIITCIGVLVILFALNQIYLEKNYFHLYREGTEKFDHIPSSIKIANFGNCYGEIAFNYSDIDTGKKESFNFALTGQDSYTDYLVFKNYAELFSRGSVIFLPVSYYPLYLEEPKYDSKFKSQNMRYYYFMDRENINRYSVHQEILARLNGLKSLFKDLIKDELGIPGNPMLYANASNINDLKQVSKAETEKVLIEIKYYERLQKDCFFPTPLMRNAYIEIIKTCDELDLKPILITTPFLSEFTTKLPKDYKERFYQEITELTEEYNVTYLDYSKDERISNNINYFADPTHLNNEGSLEFTSILMNDLLEQGIITEDFLAR